jgi:hypothetical protein
MDSLAEIVCQTGWAAATGSTCCSSAPNDELLDVPSPVPLAGT